MAAGWATLKAAETHAFDWSGTQCRSQGRLRRLVNKCVGAFGDGVLRVVRGG